MSKWHHVILIISREQCLQLQLQVKHCKITFLQSKSLQLVNQGKSVTLSCKHFVHLTDCQVLDAHQIGGKVITLQLWWVNGRRAGVDTTSVCHWMSNCVWQDSFTAYSHWQVVFASSHQGNCLKSESKSVFWKVFLVGILLCLLLWGAELLLLYFI